MRHFVYLSINLLVDETDGVPDVPLTRIPYPGASTEAVFADRPDR
jgi:hypothetical protein